MGQSEALFLKNRDSLEMVKLIEPGTLAALLKAREVFMFKLFLTFILCGSSSLAFAVNSIESIQYDPNSNDRYDNLDTRSNSRSSPAYMGAEESKLRPDITSNRFISPRTPFDNEERRLTGGSQESRRELTAEDTSRSPQDMEMIRRIRSEITSNPSLSLNAQNVKVISQNGSVYLKGFVDDTNERIQVEEIARRFAGNRNVINQTSVQTQSGTSTQP